MNGWYLTGRVIARGYRRGERGPWPCLIETEGGTRNNPTTTVPVDIFGDVEVGQHVELTGVLEGREWNGKQFLQLSVKTRKVEWPAPPSPPPPYQQREPPAEPYRQRESPPPPPEYPEDDIPF